MRPGRPEGSRSVLVGRLFRTDDDGDPVPCRTVVAADSRLSRRSWRNRRTVRRRPLRRTKEDAVAVAGLRDKVTEYLHMSSFGPTDEKQRGHKADVGGYPHARDV